MAPLVIRMMILGASGTFRMLIVGDATNWSIILTTLELSFMIVKYL
jgi:hypothetical protein